MFQVAASELRRAMCLMCLVEDMWSWLTEVPAAYLYIDKWYNGKTFQPDYRNMSTRQAQVSMCRMP